MRAFVFAVLSVAMLALSPHCVAREQDDGDGLCWDPDIEFPVPCGEDEE